MNLFLGLPLLILICCACILLLTVQSLQLGFHQKRRVDYDMIVIGAGASGMFAAGTASSFGLRTLLIEKNDQEQVKDFNVGGDCTNAACVPSKAVRCAAQVAHLSEQASILFQSTSKDTHVFNFSPLSRRHASTTTNAVRNREVPGRIASSPNIDIMFTSGVSFDSPKQVTLRNPYLFNTTYNGFIDNNNLESKTVQLNANKFIICTGAGPSIPSSLEQSAKNVGLPILTYRSLFRPDGEGIKSEPLWNITSSKNQRTKVVIVGGGSTACEIAQSLARVNKHVEITMIAPDILPSEDVSARAAARTILNQEGVNILIKRRAIRASSFGEKQVLVLDNDSHVPVDILICATGRTPGDSLQTLQLDNAGIKWSHKDGVIVNSKLQSVSTKHVYAAGDCASSIPRADRRAAHAGWTGYHSVQSAVLPKFLIPSNSIHPVVPRVTFLDPEIASIGLSRTECVEKFGSGGFSYLKASENGTDRADIDSIQRSTIGFIELRVSNTKGAILGATVCLPGASELVNEIGVAIVNKLTVRDIAKCIHTYPSYGYLMHRVALSLALGNMWGMLAACGPLGRLVGSIGRTVQGCFHTVVRRRRKSKALQTWESTGMDTELDFTVPSNFEGLKSMTSISFLEASEDQRFCEAVRRHLKNDVFCKSTKEVLIDFVKWLDSRPD